MSTNLEFTKLREENERLKRGIRELSILNEIATTISSTMELDRIIEIVIRKCIKNLLVEQAAIWLLNPDDLMRPLNTMIRNYDSSHENIAFRLNNQITGWMLKNKKPLICNDLKSDKRFFTSASDPGYNSLLSVPLNVKSKMTGLIALFNKKSPTGFTNDDKKILSIIASFASQIIENARLLEEEQQFLSVQQEMRLAGEIQKNLLPTRLPRVHDYEFAGISIPAKDVGGDYYDFIALSEDQIVCCLGDVSGKGMPAAMLMSNLQATMHSQVLHDPQPISCMATTNRLLYHSTDTKQYATFFYAILNWKEHVLKFTNAGHNPPLLFKSDQAIVELKTVGIPLGFLESFDYTQASVTLDKDDFLIIYSDGISEAMDTHENEFGVDRMIKSVNQARGQTAKQIIDKLLKDVQAYTVDAQQSDDITVMVLKRTC